MSSCTDVTLTVLREHTADVLKRFDNIAERWDDLDTSRYGRTFLISCFTFMNIPRGMLDVSDLAAQGIALRLRWESFDEFSAGTYHLWFTEMGQLVSREISDDDYAIPISELLPLVGDHQALESLILSRDAALQVPDWEHQEAYGRRYLMMRNGQSPDPIVRDAS
ncbi:hypothetical protein [Carnimonas bestiolae]|uniref:hypothetical protein n=1 Tax=Carnimonas bestiolae TaxID=3402172 RepID=UPI003EDCA30D